MDIHRLLGDELTYELQIRGLPIGGTVKQKRDTLRGILAEERLGNIQTTSEINIDPSYEFSVCEGKLSDLEDAVINFDAGNAKNDFRRISSRLMHLKLRLNRIGCSDSEIQEVRNDMLTWCEKLKADLDEVYQGSQIVEEHSPPNLSLLDIPNPLLPDRINSNPENLPSNIEVGEVLGDVDIDEYVELVKHISNATPTKREQHIQSVRSNRISSLREKFEKVITLQKPIYDRPSRKKVSLPEHSSIQANSTLYSPAEDRIRRFSLSKSNPVPETSQEANCGTSLPAHILQNLPLCNSSQPPNSSTFIGPDNSYYYDVSRWKIQYDGWSSVTNFLERVEELRVSRGVSKGRLLRSAAEIFTKDALLWFRMNNFTSWDDLTDKLRAAFQPHDYEYSLWEEIRRRTQGSQERVISYVSVMESLFKKLSALPSEPHRVELIRRNMLPNIQTQLSLHSIERLSELIRLARAVEETDWRVQKFQPPPSNVRHLVEPELAYKKPVGLNVSSVETKNTNKAVLANAEATQLSHTSSPVCWNCKSTGHRFRKCSQPKDIFCYKCGKPNVTSNSCGCSKNVSTPRRQ